MSRGVYHVTNLEEGKAAQRDQSYRSCLLSLVIFLFLCIILILASLPWRKNYSYNTNFENGHQKSAEGLHNQHHHSEHQTTADVPTVTKIIEKHSNSTKTERFLSTSTTTAKILTSSVPDDKIYFPEEILTPSVPQHNSTIIQFPTTPHSTPESEATTSVVTDSTTGREEETTIKTIAFTTTATATTSTTIPSTTTTTPSTTTVSTTSTTIPPTTTASTTRTTIPSTTTTIPPATTTTASTTSTIIPFTTTASTTITTIPSTTTASTTSTTIPSTTTASTTSTIIPFTTPTSTITTTIPSTTTASTTVTTIPPTTTTIPSTTTTESIITTDSTFVTNTNLSRDLGTVTDIVTDSTTESEEKSITTSTPITEASTTNTIIPFSTTTSTITTTIPSTTTASTTTTESIITTDSTFVADTNPSRDLGTATDIVTDSTTESEEKSISTTTPITEASTTSTIIPFTTAASTITTTIPSTTTASTTVTTIPPTTTTSTSTTTATIPSTTTEGIITTHSTFVTVTNPSRDLGTDTDIVTDSTTESEEISIISTTPITEASSTITTTIPSTTTTQYATTTNATIATTSSHKEKREVCTTSECKNLASKMLFYMNHAADPCEDFYEYACGSFEANPQTVNLDSEKVAYQRIQRQMEKEMNAGNTSLFITYYNSCMQYEDVNQTERIREARKALDRIGKFYTADNFDRSNVHFTELVAQMLLYNSPLLFDVSPILDKKHPNQFTLKIGPTTYSSPFETEENSCYASWQKRDQETVDLKELYKEYAQCKHNTTKFIKSIADALTALGVFDELGNQYNISQYVQTTVFNIDVEIVNNFLMNFPPKELIREPHLQEEVSSSKFDNMAANWKIINWKKLVKLLMESEVEIAGNATIEIHFFNALNKGFKNLETFGSENPMELNNALLGLYAQQIYQQMVLSKRNEDREKYCLRVAANLLIPDASSLYISTFSSDELHYMNETIHSLFEELKETLKLTMENETWIQEGHHEKWLAKVDHLKVVAPDISYLTEKNSTYNLMKSNKIYLTDNYVNNSMNLMRNYRARMYAQLITDASHPEQIWTYHATPFQSKGLAIRELNLVVIPFGAIDWSAKYDEPSFYYIKLATLGTTIAHQIAHHFDANAAIIRGDDSRSTDTDKDFDVTGYIECHKVLYGNRLDMTLPSTKQTVYFSISELTLNERLSETMGLRLAYDTLDRLRSHKMRSHKEVHLPWLELVSDQLFYLTYAQMHCTKLPLTSSYISLYEDEQLPSRIRIFVSASNDRLLGDAWKCPEGSRIIPSLNCGVFPHLPSSS
nr:neprilysin-1-like [Nomia melanderi]